MWSFFVKELVSLLFWLTLHWHKLYKAKKNYNQIRMFKIESVWENVWEQYHTYYDRDMFRPLGTPQYNPRFPKSILKLNEFKYVICNHLYIIHFECITFPCVYKILTWIFFIAEYLRNLLEMSYFVYTWLYISDTNSLNFNGIFGNFRLW